MKAKRLGVVWVVAVATLGLAGCKMTAHYTLHEDNTVSGEYIIAMDKDLAQETGLGPEDLRGLSDRPSFGHVDMKSEEYEDSTTVGMRYTFADEPIEGLVLSMNGTVVREGDSFIFEGSLFDTSEFDSEVGLEDLKEVFPDSDISVSITFPGGISETNGSVEGNTVTWDLLTLTEAPYAAGSANGTDGGVPGWAWIALIGGAIVLVGIVTALSRRSGADAQDKAASSSRNKKNKKNRKSKGK